ncbi:hypothetical protein ACRAKI_01575 [Saccharothrix isguenensis]
MFEDPLAGLVTGEQPYRREAVAPIVVPSLTPPQPPSAPYVPSARGPVRGPARAQRPAQPNRSAQPNRPVPSRRPARSQRPVESYEPAQSHVANPYAFVRDPPGRQVAPRQPGPPRRQPVRAGAGQQAPKLNKSSLIGCLVALAAVSGLLFNVVREIIQAAVDLLK